MWNSTDMRGGRGLLVAALCCCLMLLTGCGGGGADGVVGGDQDVAAPTSLNQAAYQSGTGNYVFGYASIPNIRFTNAPADTDFSRWAMLHDGSAYRLYFFKRDSMSLYQFGFNGNSYAFGHDSIAEIAITGVPADADTSSFKMLHDGTTYRLFMRGVDKTKLYQFGFNGSSYAFGYRSIPVLSTTGAPADADFSRWAMFHDGSVYRQCVARVSSEDKLYQFGFSGSSYAFGYRSTPELNIVGMPESSETESFSMLHDGTTFRFFHLSE